MVTLTEFLQAAPETVAQMAPPTVLFAAGGTRRDAVLHGVSVATPAAMVAFSMRQFAETAGRLFALGVRHLVTVAIYSKQLQETGAYHRQRGIEAVRMALGTHSYPYYRALNCRARLIGAEEVPELATLAEELHAETQAHGPATIWWLATASAASVWQRTIAAAQGAASHAEVVRRYFGEDVPPAGMVISFGKPFLSPEIVPLVLLGGETHCYYYQRPGYRLSDEELRAMIYDYAYIRRTWLPDKQARYDEVPAQHAIWSRNPILGLGQRIGPFWYPAGESLPDISV